MSYRSLVARQPKRDLACGGYHGSAVWGRVANALHHLGRASAQFERAAAARAQSSTLRYPFFLRRRMILCWPIRRTAWARWTLDLRIGLGAEQLALLGVKAAAQAQYHNRIDWQKAQESLSKWVGLDLENGGRLGHRYTRKEYKCPPLSDIKVGTEWMALPEEAMRWGLGHWTELWGDNAHPHLTSLHADVREVR